MTPPENRAPTDLLMVCAPDIAGQLRGKGMPLRDLDKRAGTGVGWTPTNVFITSFGPIAASPHGALGDLMLRPDRAALVDLKLPEHGVDELFALGDILTLEGARWSCCLRGQLRAAIERLESRFGLRIKAAFEHEFHYSGTEAQPGLGYALRARRRLGDFPNRLLAVLEAAGVSLDTFMPEYGPGQCEVTVGPRDALRAADEASILRELTRAAARSLDARASFAPILDPDGVGNGVHVHFSLYDLEGRPVSHDPERADGVSAQAGAFLAGICARMPEFIALTAPGVTSYLRLTPNRWSAAYNNFGVQDREAGLRVCPVFGGGDVAKKFHFEYRAADAAASPHLVLAALLNAGLDGLERDLPPPKEASGDLSAMSQAALAARGIERLPQSLDQALTRLSQSAWARDAFGAELIEAVRIHKVCEIAEMDGLDARAQCARYAAAY